jgi:hypothetical protein
VAGITVYDSSGNLTDISKVLKEHYEKPFLQILDSDSSMFDFFPRKSGEGADIQLKAHYDGQGSANVHWFGEQDAYETPGHQRYENASIPYVRVRINIKVSRFAQAVSKGNGAYIDELASEMEGAMVDLKTAINDRIMDFAYDPSNTTTLKTMSHSLGSIINDGATAGYASYAGIDRTVNTWWQPVIEKNGAGNLYALADRALTPALMKSVRQRLAARPRKAKATHILTSQTHFDQYGELFSDRRRWDGGSKNFDLGYDTLDYFGVPVVAIVGMQPGRMFFIRKPDWNYYTLLAFETEEVPSNTDEDVFAIKQYAQLVCRNPQNQGCIVNLSA